MYFNRNSLCFILLVSRRAAWAEMAAKKSSAAQINISQFGWSDVSAAPGGVAFWRRQRCNNWLMADLLCLQRKKYVDVGAMLFFCGAADWLMAAPKRHTRLQVSNVHSCAK